MSILVCTSARAGDLMHPEGTSPDEALQLKEVELHLLPKRTRRHLKLLYNLFHSDSYIPRLDSFLSTSEPEVGAVSVSKACYDPRRFVTYLMTKHEYVCIWRSDRPDHFLSLAHLT
jgi:hypothetical protein